MEAKSIKIVFLLCCGLFLYTASKAQVKISGNVTTAGQLPVPMASVTLKGTNTGATTDSLGHFQFTAQTKGRQVLVVSSVGYKTASRTVTIGDTSITVNVILSDDKRTLDAVTISAGAFIANDKAKGASLHPMDAMTVAGNGGDIAIALRSLPGTQQVGEKEGLYVRGGTGEESKQFIDGIWYKDPNFTNVPGILQPPRSFNGFLFSGILFSSGGYSAQYGQAMSSALILESIDFPDKSSASLNIFPSNIGTGFQQLSKNKKSSVGGGLSYSNTSLYNKVVPQRPDFFHGPEYWRGNANVRFKTSRTGILKVYATASFDNIGIRNQDVDSLNMKSGFQVKGKNLFATVSYRENLGRDWKLQAATVYSYNQDKLYNKLLNEKNEQVFLTDSVFAWKNRNADIRTDFAQGRVVLTRSFNRNQALYIGAEHFYADDRLRSNDSLYHIKDNLTAAFVEGDIYLGYRMMARVGARFEHSSLLKRSTVSPRASLAYRFGDGGQLNLAYGMFYQKPENEYLFRRQDLNFSRADHYILNYTKKVSNRLLRVEAYYKKYHNLVKLYPDINNSGSGEAKGIEFFWRDKKSVRNLDYWITYTYLDTKRDYLNYPYSIQPAFATPHTAAVVAKRFFPDAKLSVNVAYNFATGRPYYDIRQPGGKAQVFDQGTTRAYHSFNLSGAYMFNLFKKWKNKDFSGIGFGVNNIFGSKQVYGYQYSYNGLHKTPVLPTADRTYYIGIFMSFGIDRTDEFIDSNL